MRVGIVGTGRIGRYHAQILQAHSDVDALVIREVDPARASEVAALVGAEVAGSFEELLDRVDAVVIASPTDTHVDLIHASVDAGLPTFCEKPTALDLHAATAVVRHVEEADAVVQVGFQRRFDSGYQLAREAVQDGTLGRIYVVRIAGHDPAPPHESYIPASGGIFRDLHIHDFDIVRWVLGQDIQEVYVSGAVRAHPVFDKYDDFDTVAATLTFRDGTLGVLTGARHDPLGYDIRLEIFGSGDSISVGWDARTPLRSIERGMPGPESPYDFFLNRFDEAYRKELRTFVDVAQGRVPVPCTVRDAEIALRVALACMRSLREHRPVEIDEIV